ncbi:UTP--glucose-1-phosphate uridylyltransferase [subsurface metagenome]
MPTLNPQSPIPNLQSPISSPQSPMKAMILAAGEGMRLRPLTLETPKILLPIEGTPLIQYTLAWLKSHGISEVAINLHHLGEKIKDFLGDGSKFGVRICYSPEEKLLGTAGGVKKMEKFFDGTFAVVYGDVLTDFNLSAMANYHKEKKALGTLALFQAPNPWQAGIVEIDKQGRLLRFREKPPRGSESGNLSSGGVYILEKDILSYILGEGFCDFGYDVFPKLVELALPLYGYILEPQDYLIDIGTPEKYHKAQEIWQRVLSPKSVSQ